MSDETTTTDLGQPFAPGGVFVGGNVRLGEPTEKGKAENERADTELRDSMRAAGWPRRLRSPRRRRPQQ